MILLKEKEIAYLEEEEVELNESQQIQYIYSKGYYDKEYF